MKAIKYYEYGAPDVLKFEDVEKPEPKANEVLIRTYFTTVTSGDWRARSLILPAGFGWIARLIFGISQPRQKILGGELAAVVESVGKNVTRFQAGDRVFIFTGAKGKLQEGEHVLVNGASGCVAQWQCKSQRPSGLMSREFVAEQPGVG